MINPSLHWFGRSESVKGSRRVQIFSDQPVCGGWITHRADGSSNGRERKAGEEYEGGIDPRGPLRVFAVHQSPGPQKRGAGLAAGFRLTALALGAAALAARHDLALRLEPLLASAHTPSGLRLALRLCDRNFGRLLERRDTGCIDREWCATQQRHHCRTYHCF